MWARGSLSIRFLAEGVARAELTLGGRLGDFGLTDVLLLGDGLGDSGEMRVRGPKPMSALGPPVWMMGGKDVASSRTAPCADRSSRS